MNRKSQAAWAVLTNREEITLLGTTRQSTDPAAFRDYVLLSTALATGLRVREIAELRVVHILTTSGRVRQIVDLPFAKYGSKEPAYLGEPIRLRLAAWVKELQIQNSGKLSKFAALWPAAGTKTGRRGCPLSVRMMQHLLKRRLRDAGIDRRIVFRSLRHTAISRVAERTNGNMPVIQKFARHRDPSTTSVYIHASPEIVLRAADEALVG